MRSLLHPLQDDVGPCFDDDGIEELLNFLSSTFSSTHSLTRPILHPLDLVSATCWPLVLESCRVSLLWLGRPRLLAASWPTSQTCRHPLRHLPLDLPSQLLLLPFLLLHPPLSLDLLPRHKPWPLLSSNLCPRCRMATVASSIYLYWAAWSSLLPSLLTFTGSTAKLT